MAVVETIEGTDGPLWFHYDVTGDVLYIRLADLRDAETVGEETDDGLIVLRTVDHDRLAGMTVVNWWKRFGRGGLPDSVRDIAAAVQPWAARLRSAA